MRRKSRKLKMVTLKRVSKCFVECMRAHVLYTTVLNILEINIKSPFDDFPGSHRISSGPLAPVKSAGFQKWPKRRFSETSHFTPKH